MTCNFRVGQKVVCFKLTDVDGGISRARAIEVGAVYPEEGRVYTVRKVFMSELKMTGVLLYELKNEAASIRLGMLAESGFLSGWFRPVVQRKTDISVFKDMLKTSKALSPKEAR